MNTKPFVYNLYNILESPERTDVIIWGEHGESFLIISLDALSPSILEYYFNISSTSLFIKTICAHGFYRQRSTSDTFQRYGADVLEFKHCYFKKGRPDLLHNIKTKVTAKPVLSGYSGSRQNSLDRTIDLQGQIIKAIATTSEHLRTILMKLAMLKQEWMTFHGLEQFKSPEAIVFESDVCSRISMISFLNRIGFDTCVADSGNDLVFRCERKGFGIIVMSFGILNILAVLRRVVAVKGNATVILTYSNFDVGGGNFEDFRKMGVDEILVKPYVEEQLITVMKRLA